MQLSQQPDSFQRRSSFQELRLCFMRSLFRFKSVNFASEELELTTLKRRFAYISPPPQMKEMMKRTDKTTMI